MGGIYLLSIYKSINLYIHQFIVESTMQFMDHNVTFIATEGEKL